MKYTGFIQGFYTRFLYNYRDFECTFNLAKVKAFIEADIPKSHRFFGFRVLAHFGANQSRMQFGKVFPQFRFSEFGRNVFDKHGGSANHKSEILLLIVNIPLLHQLEILCELVDVDGRVQVVDVGCVLDVSQFSQIFAVFGQDGEFVECVLVGLFIFLALIFKVISKVKSHSVKSLGNFVQSEGRVWKHLLVGENDPVLVGSYGGFSQKLSVLYILCRVDAILVARFLVTRILSIFVVIDEHGLENGFGFRLLYAVNSANCSKHCLEHVANGADIVVAVNGGNVHGFQSKAVSVNAGVDSVNVVGGHCLKFCFGLLRLFWFVKINII